METRPTKLCIHCRFYMPHGQPENGLCARSATLYNPVTGEQRHRYAENERESTSPTACGPGGVFYQHDNSDVLA